MGTVMNKKNGLVILLVESSLNVQRDITLPQPSGMSQHVPLSELVIASVSRFLQNLSKSADVGIVVGGYSIDGNDNPRLTSRTGDEVSDFRAEFLSSVVKNPLEVKSVSRNTPSGPVAQEVPLHFRLNVRNEKASQAQAFHAAYSLLNAINPSVAIVINICCSESAGANPQQVVEQIMQSDKIKSQVINIHMGSGKSDVAIKYPSRKLALRGLARQLFSRTSELTPAMAKSLKSRQQNTLAGAKALIVNGSMVDLAELLASVSEDIAGSWPDGELVLEASIAPIQPPDSFPVPELEPIPEIVPELIAEPEPELSTPEAKVGSNVLFIVGTGVEDPFSDASGIAVRKLLDVVNETIEACRELDASLSLVTVSKDSDGDLDVSSNFPGDKSLSFAVASSSICDAAVDVVDSVESVSDGAGGLIEVPRKKSIFLRAEPGFQSGFEPFMAPVRDSIQAQNAAKQILVLFFAGLPTSEDVSAVESLKADGDRIILGYVQTIAAHPPVGIPQKDTSKMQDPSMARLAECCQILLTDDTPQFGLCVNSSRGLIKFLKDVAAAVS